jgi:hypothetical protein
LIGAIDHVLANPGLYDEPIERQFAAQMRVVQSYLSGSTTNEIPYEVVFCLNDALKRWISRGTLIVTQLTEGHDFHLRPVDPWSFIRTTLTGYDTGGFDVLLVMIGVPRLYAHKPIFCIPLYHELGHFVDVTLKLSEITLLLSPAPTAPAGCHEILHRREYFADLFSSCFVGRVGMSALEAIAPDHPTSSTHPSTADRVVVVEAFLTGLAHPIVDMFQTAVTVHSLPKMISVFAKASVASEFDDLRTFSAASVEEIHGIFEGAWGYLFDVIDQKRNPWKLDAIKDGDSETIVNDLTEKSIRNYSIRVAWNEAAPS